ncbi:MAG: hypothetical protein LBC76_11090 [Treponema sp.]|jgi:transcription elongation factor Elf1|nr:hypothetical protein [Treponema sp.]
MMNNNGQFNVPNNTKVECEFPCSSCGKTVTTEFLIKPDSHSDKIANCACGKSYDVTVTHNTGTGIVNVDVLKDQSVVKAQGLP